MFQLASVFGFFSVALGAFAAHGLKERLSPEAMQIFRTGVEYQFFHALALFVVAFRRETHPSSPLRIAGQAFVLGSIVFSGSLYLLALTGYRWFGAITPIGGMAFLVGWGMLGFSFRQKLSPLSDIRSNRNT